MRGIRSDARASGAHAPPVARARRSPSESSESATTFERLAGQASSLLKSSISALCEERLHFSQIDHQEPVYAKRIQEYTSYLAGRPDFEGADRMRFNIAWHRCHLRQFDEAQEILDELLAKDDLPTWLRDQSEALRGYAASHGVSPTPTPRAAPTPDKPAPTPEK